MEGVSLEELPEEVQREMWEQLNKKFGHRRDGGYVSREKRVKAMADVLLLLKGFTVPQQRAVLRLADEVLEKSVRRYWRDGHTPGDGNKKAPGGGKERRVSR
ncbi:MAG: hypothetical protein ABIH46_04100 [Chloroflexota bacterium]